MTQYPQDPQQPNQPYGQQPPSGWQPQPPPKKKHTLRTILIVIGSVFGVLIIIGILAPGEDKGSGEQATSTTAPGPATTAPKPAATTTAPAPTKPSTAQPKPTKTAPAMTASQKQAIGSAESYLSFSAFSRKGLIRQLSSDAGEGFSVADATYAVDHIKVNWNEQAAKAAKAYLAMTHFSRKGLIQQLESSAGDEYTHAQAVYGVTKAGL